MSDAPADLPGVAGLRSGLGRLIAQGIGFAIGLGLLVLIVREALGSDEARAQLEELAKTPWWILGGVVAIAIASIVANAMLFWVLVRPVKTLPLWELVCVNAIATGLSYLPFKLSVIFRFVVHNRRDGIPLLTIGGWLASVAASLVPVLVPVGLALAIGSGGEASESRVAWWLGVLLLIVASFILITRLSAFFSTGRGWNWGRRLLERVLGRRGARLANSELADQVRVGAGIMASAPTMGLGFIVRFFDIALVAVRFLIVASILGVELSPEKALVAACVYFVVGAAAPTGTAGVREGATLGAFGFDESMLALILAVSAADVIAAGLGTVAGLVWLRPDRILAQRDPTPSTPATPPPPPTTAAGGSREGD